jgi:7-cyano-7-deazaguanine synthase in queuosine biosynthesis
MAVIVGGEGEMDRYIKHWIDARYGFETDATMLANLSGGIDSAYGCYFLMKMGHKLLIHHCNVGPGCRAECERKATYACLDWYRANGFGGRFDYIESSATMPPSNYKSRLREIELVMVFSGAILRDQPGIKKLAYFNNAEDLYSRLPDAIESRARIDALYRTARRDNIRIIRPLSSMTKAEIVEIIPPPLLLCTHWCRFPREGCGSCGVCYTCRRVLQAIYGGGDGETGSGSGGE